MPVGEGLACGQPVERAVVLHRGIPGRVVFEPALLWHVGWVEHAAPMAVLPARGSDEYAHASLSARRGADHPQQAGYLDGNRIPARGTVAPRIDQGAIGRET